jgi:2-oxoisovalerate dehydrogenase E2 component (dihydrolipoyl transacylase)
VVLKLAEEHSIDLSLVQGTGIEGRVTRQDVMRYLENPVAHTVPPPPEAGVVGAPSREPAAAPGSPKAVTPAGGEVVLLSPTRRTIAARLLDSHRNVPVAWMAIEADVTELVSLRDAVKEEFLRTEGVALTYLPFFIQAIVAALKEHPALNATFSGEGIRVHKTHDIGIAVAAESGLIVPVVRAADGKSIAALARELEDLGERARARKLRLEEVSGATFTIDNTGAFGSVLSQPIVPPGQVAIITTEAIRREPRVASDGSTTARSVMNLCISFDHRALDGAQAGWFMQAVKHNLESLHRDAFVY